MTVLKTSWQTIYTIGSVLTDARSRPPLRQLFGRQPLCSRQRVRCGGFYVGHDSTTFPVRQRDRVDRARVWHSNDEAIVDALALHWMRAPARRLSNEGGSFEVLEVVAELLGAG